MGSPRQRERLANTQDPQPSLNVPREFQNVLLRIEFAASLRFGNEASLNVPRYLKMVTAQTAVIAFEQDCHIARRLRD